MADEFLELFKVRCIDNKNRTSSTVDVPTFITEYKIYSVIEWGFIKQPDGTKAEGYRLKGVDPTLWFLVDRFNII